MMARENKRDESSAESDERGLKERMPEIAMKTLSFYPPNKHIPRPRPYNPSISMPSILSVICADREGRPSCRKRARDNGATLKREREAGSGRGEASNGGSG